MTLAQITETRIWLAQIKFNNCNYDDKVKCVIEEVFVCTQKHKVKKLYNLHSCINYMLTCIQTNAIYAYTLVRAYIHTHTVALTHTYMHVYTQFIIFSLLLLLYVRLLLCTRVTMVELTLLQQTKLQMYIFLPLRGNNKLKASVRTLK